MGSEDEGESKENAEGKGNGRGQNSEREGEASDPSPSSSSAPCGACIPRVRHFRLRVIGSEEALSHSLAIESDTFSVLLVSLPPLVEREKTERENALRRG